MKNKMRKGFTLIELLVVIAIIGILSAVILASVNIVRSKGADANIKQNLANIRAQASIFYDDATPNSYLGACASSNIVSIMTSAMKASGDTALITERCFDSDNAWVAWVPLKTSTTTAWCVDHNGTSKEIDVATAPVDPATPCEL